MLLPLIADGDERKGLDKIMTKLRAIVEATGVHLIVVSHLSRPPGDKGHEQGLEIQGRHARGSHSLIQLSDNVIGLERNQQSENLIERNTTRVRIIKWRRTGNTGIAGYLLFDPETGRLTPSAEPPASEYGFEDMSGLAREDGRDTNDDF